MGLAKLLTRAASPNVHAASGAAPPYGPTQFMAGPEQQFPSTSALPPPTETQALSVPAFWRGCAYVCGSVGMLPCVAYRGTDALDPQPPVIVQPDPNQTPMAFWTGIAESLALYGNAISIITSTDRSGWPVTLKPIHPTLAAVRFTGNPMAPTISAWYIAGQIYDPTEIWHVKSHLGRAGWPLGRGLIDVNGDAIAISLALQGYAGSYFAAGGMPTGILKVHRPEVTQAQADTARSNWIAKYAGRPSVAVLNELTDFTPVAYNAVDSQMVESRSFSLIETALMWGLPPSKLGANVGGGTYKNAEMEEVQARNDAVAPWTRLLEQAGSIELLPRGQTLQWDLAASLRTDTLSQYQAYQTALGGPGPASQWQLVDEIRARENLDPMAMVEAEIEATLKAAGVEPEPEEVAPVVPALPGGPPVGNEQFGTTPTAAQPATGQGTPSPPTGKGP
jgi:HK97 family phage portal protein